MSYLPPLLHGAALSLLLTLSALGIGLLLTLLSTLGLALHLRFLYRLLQAYLLLFTGTPLLIQIFLIYHGFGALAATYPNLISDWLATPIFCAILALALNSTAYSTQLLYQTWRTLPQGYVDACYALGMTRTSTVATLLPLAIKRALPAYSNEVILIFKSTSLASTITLMELMGQAQQLNYQTYDTLTVFVLTGAIYLLITGLLILIMRQVTQRLLKFTSHS